MRAAGSWGVRALTTAVVLQLVTAGAVAVAVGREPRPVPPPTAAVVQPPVRAVQPPVREVEALLAERSRAVLSRDRAAFLATVDQADAALTARQAAVFDALARVPLTTWAYRLLPGAPVTVDGWRPRLVLATALEGVDPAPAEAERSARFVRRDGRWLLAQDEPSGARQLWDEGPVDVVRGAASLVLGPPGRLPELRRLATEVDAAVPRVSAVWGTGWAQRVAVVVPADGAQLARLVPTSRPLSGLAALAVSAPSPGGRSGDRVLVQPDNLARLSAASRSVVLTHEVLHVAARAATGPATPAWLSEGLADHVGYLGTGTPVARAAGELRAQVRAGQVPAALPAAAEFTGERAGPAYEGAWLAVELLVREHGRDAVLALYRDLGTRTGPDALEQALRAHLGTGVAELTADWQASLRRQLG